jgi:hypothetical protein
MTFRRAAIPFDTSDELYGPILGVSRMAALFHRPTKNFLQNLTHTTHVKDTGIFRIAHQAAGFLWIGFHVEELFRVPTLTVANILVA